MESQGKQKSVSRAHAEKAAIPKRNGNNRPAKAAALKKSQLHEAVGEFNKQEERSTHNNRSLLSDEGTVLHVGNEAQGTILKDTKHERSRVTDAIKTSLSNWFSKTQAKLEKRLQKPEPKKTIASVESRAETVKKAAEQSSLPKTDAYKSVKPRRPIPGRRHAQSSVRIKEKDVPKEIGDTKPRWTHVMEEKTQHQRQDANTDDATAPESMTQITTPVKPTKTEPKTDPESVLLESPRHGRRLLESPEDRRPRTIEKTYRPMTNAPTIRVRGPVATTTKPEQPSSGSTPDAPQPTKTEQEPTEKPVPRLNTFLPDEDRKSNDREPTTDLPTSSSTALEATIERESIEASTDTDVPPEDKTALANDVDADPATTATPANTTPETPAIPIVTIVLVIIFIAALAISTTILQSL